VDFLQNSTYSTSLLTCSVIQYNEDLSSFRDYKCTSWDFERESNYESITTEVNFSPKVEKALSDLTLMSKILNIARMGLRWRLQASSGSVVLLHWICPGNYILRIFGWSHRKTACLRLVHFDRSLWRFLHLFCWKSALVLLHSLHFRSFDGHSICPNVYFGYVSSTWT